MRLGSKNEMQDDLPEQQYVELAVVDAIEGQALQNVFRGMIIATKDIDYHEGCAKGLAGECEKRRLLQVLRKQFAKKHPSLYAAGAEGPEARQFRSWSPHCQSCIINGGRTGRYFPGNVKEEKEEESKKVEDDLLEPVEKKRHFWQRRPVLEGEVMADEVPDESPAEASKVPEIIVPTSIPVSAELLTSQAYSAVAVEAPNIIPREREDVVARADLDPKIKISETARTLRTGSRSSRAKIYSEIGRIEKKAPEAAAAVEVSYDGAV